MRSLNFLAPSLLAGLLLSPLPAALAAEAPNPADAEMAYLRMVLPDEELVESATRAPKPLSQIAENVTVVTSDEIEAMNAHTLGEVLNRVTGVFVQPLTGGTFGDVFLAHIQGSGFTDFVNTGAGERHVTLLIDGVPWTQVGSGTVLINTVPVGLIDRIEVVKGPASSIWGSALGGVINVLTKKAGTSTVPHGSAYGSYGERRTYDTRAEAAGAAGILGYYLEAEAQGAHWQRTHTDYGAKSLFGKFEARPVRDLTLGVTVVSFRPEYEGERSAPFVQDYGYPSFLASASADARLSPAASLHVVGFLQKIGQDSDSSWDGTPAYGLTPPEGERGILETARERNRGLSGLLSWAGERHTVVIGADYFKGRVKNSFENGPTLVESFGFEPSGESVTFLERWGVYANDTAQLGPLTLTPGLRYDETSRTDALWSPSLGGTLRLGVATLLRAQAARGFTVPPLNDLSGDAKNAAVPDLEAEKVWSWQAGVETVAVPGLRLKLTAFRHEVKGSVESDPDTGAWVNWPAVWRQGLEAEAETASFAGLSATGGFAWAWVKRVGIERDQDLYQANLGLRYARGTFRADLFGHFVWWDMGPGQEEGTKDDFLWDLTASKTVLSVGPSELDLFAGAHNLFNGQQYTADGPKTPSRWVEAGARIRF